MFSFYRNSMDFVTATLKQLIVILAFLKAKVSQILILRTVTVPRFSLMQIILLQVQLHHVLLSVFSRTDSYSSA